ncbi:MAG: transcription termination factor NusA [Alphaproteobacteria bacterium]|jgi:N utilization substance protein A|nr:transcription termination factor NusA [Alphaproteobacteria bacterium]
MDTSSIPGLELIQVADVVAREKSIEREEVMVAMEEAIQKAGRAKYGLDRDIRAMIDRKTGSITLERWIEVVEEVEDDATQMSVAEGAKQEPSLALGEFWRQSLPPIEFGRIAAQTAKQVISQKVRDAERARQYEEYKDRVGEIVVGTVKRAESYSITVDLGRAEAVIRREEMIPRENLRQGDRVRAYIIDVREEQRGPQIFLSRACNEFMAKLFTQEVPEIYDGIIEIKGVAREAGSRAKIAVLSKDSGIDPVGACVGMRGSRVQAVVGELQGEKVEIIPYIEDPASFVVNALAPAEVAKVVMDEVSSRMEVVVPDDQLSLAIGRRGQNVRLASQLSGWYIDILTEAEESERRQEEFRTRSARFIEALNIDDVIAHLLVAEGFVLPEEIAETPIEELATIQGFDEGIAEELQTRAVEFVEREAQRINEALDSLKVADDLRNFEYISLGMMLKLAENEVLSLDDLADLDSDELVALLSEHGLEDDTEAGDIIMAARAHWFDDEPEAGEASDAAEGDAVTDAAPEAAPEAAQEAVSGDEPAAS